MKHILTLAALMLATACFGQEACPNVHDINSNGTIDIEDFLSILGLFADVDIDEDGVWDSQDDCLDASACNYLASPTEPCSYLDALGECGGACEGDGDGDGICDDVDTCVGELDECGVCNGPGPTEVVIEDITILYDSVYLPQLEEWYVYEFGADTSYGFSCAPCTELCGDFPALFYQDSTVLLMANFNGDIVDHSSFDRELIPHNFELGSDRFGNQNAALSAVDLGQGSLEVDCGCDYPSYCELAEGTRLELGNPVIVTGEDNVSFSISMWVDFPNGPFYNMLAGGMVMTLGGGSVELLVRIRL